MNMSALADFRLYAVLSFALWGQLAAYAQIEFSGKYEEGFDTLLKEGRKKIGGTEEIGVQVAIPSLDGWQVARIGGSGAGLPVVLIPGEGELGEGRLYSFGHVGDHNRSLGALSTKLTSIAFGVSFVNKTGKPIQKVKVQFTGEVWRGAGHVQDAFSFAYGLSDHSITLGDFLDSPKMRALSALDLRAPSVGSNVAVDGKSSEFRAEVSATLADLNWQPGSILFLSWTAQDNPGHGAGLGMDDFSLQAE